ncbi:hypothetical protein LCGC14_1558050, partial [marine sediment metagenome]
SSGFEYQQEVLVGSDAKYRVVAKTERMVGSVKHISYEIEEVLPKKLIPKPKPKVPEGVLPKSHFDEVVDWDKRLVVHKQSLKERLGFDLDALKVGKTYTPEYKDALAKFEKALKSYTKPASTFERARQKVEVVLQPGMDKAKVTARAKRAVSKFYDRIEEIADDKWISAFGKNNIETWMYKDKKRGYVTTRYRSNVKFDSLETINMSQTASLDNFFHEMGHLLEHNSRIAQRKANMWVATRGKHKQVRYNSIASWSKDTQMAYKNKFVDPYVGKVYTTGNTEVLSMGTQQFTSYKRMLRFAKKDFDHFSLIHGILTGAI